MPFSGAKPRQQENLRKAIPTCDPKSREKIAKPAQGNLGVVAVRGKIMRIGIGGKETQISYVTRPSLHSCPNLVQGILDRDILVSGKNGSLTVPGIARLDWTFGTPFCISEKYLKQQGRGHEINVNITDDERQSASDDQLDIAGIIRKFPFRVKGTSRVFFQDFIVSKALDDVADMVIGWQFMWEEFKLLFDKVRENITGVFGEVVSNFSSKIVKVSSALRNRAAEFISRAPSPSPPYSLCDVFEPDFTVRPNYS